MFGEFEHSDQEIRLVVRSVIQWTGVLKKGF
jgi:hypothetical protein